MGGYDHTGGNSCPLPGKYKVIGGGNSKIIGYFKMFNVLNFSIYLLFERTFSA